MTEAGVNDGGGADRAADSARALDPSDADAVGRFAEDVRARLVVCLDRVAEAARGHDLEQSAAALRRLSNRIGRADAALLVPRGGLGGLFDGRGKRLAAFREAFADVVRDLTETERDLGGRGATFERRTARLEALHAELKGLIAEMDDWITAGFARLTEVRSGEPEQAEPLARRLANLGELRQAVVARLPMIRACQNAEAQGPGMASGACKALTDWRDAWSRALGVEGRRTRRVRPDAGLLEDARAAVLKAVRRAEAALEEAGARRSALADRIPLSTSPREG